MIKEIFDASNKEHESSGKFSVSSIGSCWRKKYLEIKGLYKQRFDSQTQRTFDIGDMLHRQAVKELLEKGEQFNIRVVASEVDIPTQKYISGRADLILCNSKNKQMFVVDVKSAGDYTLNMAKNGQMHDNYIQQLQLYLHFFKLNEGYILVMGKHKSEIIEVQVKYDEQLCLKLIEEIEHFFVNNVEKNVEPGKCNGSKFKCDVCQ